MDEHYIAGMDAYDRGEAFASCEYPHGDPRRTEWEAGWRDRQQDDSYRYGERDNAEREDEDARDHRLDDPRHGQASWHWFK